jgi:hypothetical protein
MATYGTATYNGTSYTLYGRPGSSVIDELNRLANGGNYPTYDNYLDAQGAANKWASTKNQAIVGALNYKVSSTRQPSAYKDFNAVCNELAGTASTPDKYLEAVTALRTIAS